MGSSYFGLPNNMGSERRKSNKKSSSSEKANKQPQRGLGVAQLEQIRLRTQLGYTHNVQEDIRLQGAGMPNYGVPQSSASYPPYSQPSPSTSSPYPHNPNLMMVFGDERANTNHQDSHQSIAPRWNPNSNGVLDSSPYTQARMAPGHFFSHFEDSRKRIDLLRSSSQNSNSSDHEEVDLELRLSI